MAPKKLLFPIVVAFLLLVVVFTTSGNVGENNSVEITLTESEVVFDKMMSVITHQRCMNCHPSDNNPRQGDDSHYHKFGVQRGPENQGLAALQCGSCHQEANNLSSGVPGAPHWSLAPISMGWQGLDKYQIATAMLDRSKNGNRSVSDIEHHLTEDPLVLWVFEPGVDNEGNEREKPPLSKEEWISSVKEWVSSGAQVPTKK